MSNLQQAIADVRDGSSHLWMFYNPEDRQEGPELVEARLNATPEIVASFVAPDGWKLERVQWGDTLFIIRRQSLEREAVEAMLIELLEFANEQGMRFFLGCMVPISESPLSTHCGHSNINRHPGLDPGSAFLPDRRMKEPCVYLLARSSHGTFYTGVTSNLIQRLYQHREGTADGFTKRYGIKRLAWFERHATMEAAIHREKQIKRWARAYKYALVNELNPAWRDLAEDFGFRPLAPEGQADPGSSPG